MARRRAGEPEFGSDSFLDVTANLVGVLIILIVLIGVRVTKTPPRVAEVDAEVERRLQSLRAGVVELDRTRVELEQRLQSLNENITARRAELADAAGMLGEHDQAARKRTAEIAQQERELANSEKQLGDARAKLVSLHGEFERDKAGAAATRTLEHTPISQRVESEEIHLELNAGRVSFVDMASLLERARGNWKNLEPELRNRGRATAEVGPVGPYRLRYTMAREDMPFSQSLIYGSGSFRARLADWEVLPVTDSRGEPVENAIASSSELETILARYSPNRFAVTVWTYSDSFTAYRQLRDHLASRGYSVAARPLPVGVAIRGSIFGSRSFAQ